MRRMFPASLMAVALTALTMPAVLADDPDGYIVVLKKGADAVSIAQEHSGKHSTKLLHTYNHALHGYAASMTAAAARQISDDPRVMFVQTDQRVRLEAQVVSTGIARVGTPASPTADLDSVDERVDVDVAVVDTGIQADHPDLNVHAPGAKNCAGGVGAADGNGHGTHVAGTIGALDNRQGVVGVAPGVRLWSVRVLDDSGNGSFSSIICGVDHVTANADEIEVANLSLGATGTDDGDCGNTNRDALHQAVCASVAAGVTYAVAAGNSSVDSAKRVPAAYDEVITVSALADFDGEPGGKAASTCVADDDDTLANFSNHGRDVDLIAPGLCIRSTWIKGGYQVSSGTSMAAPHVAGAAALYKAAHPSATPSAVRNALITAGGTDWNAGDDPDGVKEPLLNVRGF
ncbi:S8 family serine peptidase [Actinocorallia populi]|uniref:S8 family serine peptidase n=1 Tax=Actinocorallia populi TaxID=2079200 RepID=UPI000D089E88|nr:S8 family serine peptidase [Actinocorallia populi]